MSSIWEGELKEVFDALEEAFSASGTDYYVIGAFARDIWYNRGDKTSRMSKDVDFAILVGSQKVYEAVKKYLKEQKNFEYSKGNAFMMLSPEGVQVDILPFGEIEIDDEVEITGEGLTSIKVNGFREVYEGGTESVELETGHQFEIATLPAIVLLKLVSFDDRPDERDKDPGDIANIIDHYFDLQADLIYGNHLDLFSEEGNELSLADISAIVIGREIKQICGSNEGLLDRLKSILEEHIGANEDSQFVRQMVHENGETVETNVQLLEHILSALT